MGVQKCINGLLLIYFLFMVIATPMIDIVHILTWYANNENGDAPSSIKIPHLAVVFIFFEHLIVWPLCIANLYGIFKVNYYASSNPFLQAAILSEMIRSSGASSTLSSIYVPFLGFALISTINGLVPHH
ncbi:hypothetical protein MKW92_013589 [Papaver armeniacum]|nr:hypothetical protein MKW92_013589 [Papaver armeniacum]